MERPRVKPPRLVLASGSPHRRMLLERLGVPFTCRVPEVDEEALKRHLDAMGPRELARLLAVVKADAIVADEPDALVLAGDQIAVSRGRMLGKPGTVEAAIEQLEALSGETHELITAVALRRDQTTVSFLDVARLSMRRLSGAEIARYVEADRPIDCAGAYKLEARGIALFDRVECTDHTAIIGLPLIALTAKLRGFGFAIP